MTDNPFEPIQSADGETAFIRRDGVLLAVPKSQLSPEMQAKFDAFWTGIEAKLPSKADEAVKHIKWQCPK